MDEIKNLVAMTALNKMLKQSYFDISTLDTIGKMLNIDIRNEAYKTLHPLHCVHYVDMPKKLMESLPELIRQCLGVDTIFQFTDLTKKAIDISPTQDKKQNIVMRFIGGKS